MAEFRMPSLGADMEAGTLAEWLIKPGDEVHRGDIVAVVETQKGAVDVEVFDSGVVDALLVNEGTQVPVGTVLAHIRTSEQAPAPAVGVSAVATPAPLPSPVVPPTPPTPAGPPAAPRHLRVSPLARKLAEELGVDLATVTGTGPGGAIQRVDIEQAAAARAPAPAAPPAAALPAPPVAAPAAAPPAPRAPTPAERHAAMRDAIAKAMARSKREIPHYYLGADIDLHRAMNWLQDENLKRPVAQRLLPTVLLLKAVALALHEVPELNGFWAEDAFQPSEAIHVGVAISLRQGGLIAPAIHHTDLLSVDDLMVALRDLVMRARGAKLRSSELTDATITVSNLGEQGVSTIFGVIYPPQVALVGFGVIAERPWALDGMLGVRPIVTVTLAADHRASDGHRGGLFLAAINRLLQEPEKL